MGLGDGIGQKKPCHHLGPFFSNFVPEKMLGLPKRIFEKKFDKCKKGDEITRFDGTYLLSSSIITSLTMILRKQHDSNQCFIWKIFTVI